jgi:beta-glucanase (GH16 family)
MIYIKSNKFIIFFFVTQLFFCSCKKLDESKWTLTFQDEFSSNELNRSIWKTGFDWGQTYNGTEQALFIDSAFSIKNGVLCIKSNRDTVTGTVYDTGFIPVQKDYYFTSGMIHSSYSFSQLYGYFEIRCKTPLGKGFWPAFWLMSPNSWPPEIDVFEISGKEPNIIHMANHFFNNNKEHRQVSANFYGNDFSKDFHVFAIEWNPKEIIWFLDNKQVYKTETCVPNERMFLIASSGMGGGEFSGYTDQSTFLPNYLEIDYIRVYKEDYE